MMETNYFVKHNYYAYSYNELNDVYLVRGLDADYNSEAVISRVPDELLETIVFEEYVRSNRIFDAKSSRGIISYSKSHCYAIVDFKGRHFNQDQVNDIVYGRKVNLDDVKLMSPLPYTIVESEKGKSFVKKFIRRFLR